MFTVSRPRYVKTRSIFGGGFATLILGHLLFGDHRGGGFNSFDVLLGMLFVVCLGFAVGTNPTETVRVFAESWREIKSRHTAEIPVPLFPEKPVRPRRKKASRKKNP